MMGNHGGWGAGGWLVMTLMMVLFWGLLIALVVWLVRSSRNRSAPSTGEVARSDSAVEVLAARFASGEIDEAQFIRGRALLQGSRAPS